MLISGWLYHTCALRVRSSQSHLHLPLPACPTDCTRLHLLHAVWASVAQTRGRRQGLYFDPWTGAPRLDTAALHYALQLVANLTAAAAPQPVAAGAGCGGDTGQGGFAAGQCAVVLDTSTAQLQVSERVSLVLVASANTCGACDVLGSIPASF